MTLDNASELTPAAGWPGTNPIFRVWFGNDVAISSFGMLPTDVVGDDAVGWLMNITLEPGCDFVGEGIPFGMATFEAEEEVGVTRMNLVTWDLSSVLGRFTPVLPMNSACVRTPELVSDGTTTVFLTSGA